MEERQDVVEVVEQGHRPTLPVRLLAQVYLCQTARQVVVPHRRLLRQPEVEHLRRPLSARPVTVDEPLEELPVGP